jgi:hypothetical protein
MWSIEANKKDESDSEDESEEESEEESDDGAGPSTAAAQELSREDRKKEKKARKDAAIAKAKAAAIQVGDLPPSDGDSEDDEDDDMPANPNHSKAARKQLEPPAPVDEATEAVSGLSIKQPQSRRERETLEAAQAQARYRKLHEEGKTDQAKADLARLAAIREKREADRARKEVFTPSSHAIVLNLANQSRLPRPSARRKRSRRRPSGPRSKPRRQRSARRLSVSR